MVVPVPPPASASLAEVASYLAAPGRGILASDESTGTIGKRLEKVGRELLYTAPIGEAGVSGAIMFKETLEQATTGGDAFVAGLTPLEGHELTTGETSTRGLEGLAAAAAGYAKAGARFAKWRAVLRVNEASGFPSQAAVELNAAQLADYAAACQGAGLVPIVEPEVLIEGPHSAAAFGAASERVIGATVAAMWARNVVLEGCLLKPQMVIPGSEFPGGRSAPADVASATLTSLRRVVPPAIPGIMFLSGGQSEEEATANLNAINVLAQQQGRAPWALSFSYGRALQASVIKTWAEDIHSPAKVAEAQAMAVALVRANAAAARGVYEGPHPSLAPASSLKETFRGHRS